MEIQRPNSQPISQEELKDLEKLKALIERAISDNILTKSEYDTIKRMAWADGKISPEEVELAQQMIWNKVQSGELVISWQT